MRHKKFSRYTFLIGSNWHDIVVKIDAYTKAEAFKEARARKVIPSDHIEYLGETVLETF